jgi:hypothetical protein
LSISHLGPDDPQKVTVTVDNDTTPVFSEPRELNFNTLDLTTWVAEKTKALSPVSKDDVHFIQFSVDPKATSRNIVFVNVFISVKGMGS